MTARSELVALLKPILLKTRRRWDLLDHETSLGTISKRTVILKQGTIRRLPAAPVGRFEVEFVVTVAVPSTDERQREIDNDEAVLELLAALDTSDSLIWTEARKVEVDDYLGYDIDVQLHIVKE